MPSILGSFRLLADPTRLRIVALLEREELSVAELQNILDLGQSTLSTHLAQLKREDLLEDRRTGKNIFYRLKAGNAPGLMDLVRQAAVEVPESERDESALRLILQKRQDKMRAYFDELAGKFGRHYVPGRSWKGLAELLLTLLPAIVVADLGAGEGTLAQMLARRAKKVIAVDSSEKMVQFGTELARRHGLKNLAYRKGDLEDLPIRSGTVDLAILSQSLHHAQHPENAVREAHRILKPGGRIAILDLRKHQFEEARDIYADVWLGFAESQLETFLREAGFSRIETTAVHREDSVPHFETLLAVGCK